jgi:hypothetical protein
MKKIDICKAAIIILSIVAIIALFLPYEKSIGSYKEILQANPDSMYQQEANITNKDAVNLSIIENFKLYNYGMNADLGSSWVKEECTINVVITIVMIASIALILLFALLKKEVAVIIFDILLAISALAMNYDIVSRGVIPSSRYTYGVSYYLYLIIAGAILICSIASIVQKKKIKKQNNE